MFYKLSIILIVLIRSFSVLAISNPPILFITYATGETQAFKEVMNILDKRKIPYGVVAVGVAAKLVEDNKNVIDIRKQCHFKTYIHPRNWEHALRIPEYDINNLFQCLKPYVIVTGMTSIMQAQIVQRFSKNGTKIVSYYDEFTKPASNPALKTIARYSNAIVVPEPTTALYFKSTNVSAHIEVLGQPAAEVWRKKVPEYNKKKVRQNIGIDESHKPVILYMGGYGNDYERSFELFVQSLPHLQDKEILIAIHPKADGSIERAILAMHKAINYITLPKSVTAIEAAAVADIIVTQRSPKASLAFFANLPLIYLDAKPENYSNIIIDSKAAKQASTVTEFLKLVSQSTKLQYTDQQLTELLGVPFNAAENMATLIESFLTAPIFL